MHAFWISGREKITNVHAWSRLSVWALAIALVGTAPVGFAQTASPPSTEADQDHSAHHPPTAASPTQSSGTQGMVSQNGPGGMMGQNNPGGMMGMKDMMSMMRNMMTMMSAQSGMMASNVEGRISSLQTELKITDAQASAWNRFAEALRATGGSMNGMYQQMMQSDPTATTLPARLDRQETMLSAHLSRIKTLKEALDPLYASFSDEQKKIANGVMIGPMGMM
jgi:hypothetical protein